VRRLAIRGGDSQRRSRGSATIGLLRFILSRRLVDTRRLRIRIWSKRQWLTGGPAADDTFGRADRQLARPEPKMPSVLVCAVFVRFRPESH
jgi:hypothetical protein